MSRPAWLTTTAGVVASTMFVAACFGGSGKSTPKPKPIVTTTTQAVTPTRSVTVHSGGDGVVEVSIRPSTDRKLRVTFAPSVRTGDRVQLQAAGWNAVAVATLVTGAPLANREIGFTTTGSIDGRTAGALLTVAVIAAIRGDQLERGLTMTGAVNPDGSIAPSGRIRRRGVPPVETRDVFDAYQRFTGTTLPKLRASTDTRLSDRAYARASDLVDSWVERYDSSLSDFQDLTPAVRQDLRPYVQAAAAEERQAKQLANAGLQAGAFGKAVNAAAFMSAVATVGQSFGVLLTQGVRPFVEEIRGGHSVTSDVADLLAGLQEFVPKTVSDAGALLAASGSAIDVVSLSELARVRFDAVGQDKNAVAPAVEGAIYYELAGTLATAALDALSIGQGLGGARLGPEVDLTDLARFFQQAAEGNLDVVRANMSAPRPGARRLSPDAADLLLTAADSQYALARTGDAVLGALPSHFGSAETRDYAELGGAISLYARTAELVAKYSSLGRVNPATLELTGIADADAFNTALEFAGNALASHLGVFRTKRIDPVIVAAAYEIAGIDGDAKGPDQFDALGDYWDGYLHSRVLAYLGGFAG